MSLNRPTLAFLFSLALAAVSATIVQAAGPTPAPATGSISGRVLDENGKPIAGIRVAAIRPVLAERRARGSNPSAPAFPPGAGTGRPIDPLAKTVTGPDGTFTLTNVPIGKVRVIAGRKGDGLGLVKELVTVQANQTTPVGDIQLHKPAATRP